MGYSISSLKSELKTVIKDLKAGSGGRFSPKKILMTAEATVLKPTFNYHGTPWNQGWGYLILAEAEGRLTIIYGSWSAPASKEEDFRKSWRWYPYAGYDLTKKKTATAAFRRILKGGVKDFDYKPKIIKYED
jgi:hypothetical protein